MAGRSATAREELAELRTIGEVAELLDLPQHVLRFWETRFREIDPVKRAGGRRLYRPRDIVLVEAIRHLLYREGYTIKGVQRILKEQGVEAVLADVRRRQNGESPAPAPASHDRLGQDAQGALDLPEPEPADSSPHAPPAVSPVVSPAVSIEIELEESRYHPVQAAPTIFNLPALIARPPTEQEDLLRQALSEIEECKRLLRVTRR